MFYIVVFYKYFIYTFLVVKSCFIYNLFKYIPVRLYLCKSYDQILKYSLKYDVLYIFVNASNCSLLQYVHVMPNFI